MAETGFPGNAHLYNPQRSQTAQTLRAQDMTCLYYYITGLYIFSDGNHMLAGCNRL